MRTTRRSLAHKLGITSMVLGLGFGVAACGDDVEADGDEIVDDVEEGAEDLGEEVEEGAENLGEELDDADNEATDDS